MRHPSEHEGQRDLLLTGRAIDRRTFLRLSAAGAGAALLAACRTTPVPGLMVFPGGLEFIAGRRQRFPFGLATPDGLDMPSATARVTLIGETGAIGPFDASRMRYLRTVLPGDPPGFYLADVVIPGARIVDVRVEASDGGTAYTGFATIQTRTEPGVPDVGEKAPSAPTPTLPAPAGAVRGICTRTPPCSMHDRSLDEALRAGRPTILTIASPEFCTSRTCGPVVDEVLSFRDAYADRASFVHVEPFGDAPPTLAAPALAWRLESEPWVFVVGAGGDVVARYEGPVVAAEIEPELRAALAARERT